MWPSGLLQRWSWGEVCQQAGYRRLLIGRKIVGVVFGVVMRGLRPSLLCDSCPRSLVRWRGGALLSIVLHFRVVLPFLAPTPDVWVGARRGGLEGWLVLWRAGGPGVVAWFGSVAAGVWFGALGCGDGPPLVVVFDPATVAPVGFGD